MNKFYIYKFFDKEEYRNTFLSGLLYSNKLSYYREHENKTMGVTDIFENADIISIADDAHYVNHILHEIDNNLYVEHKCYDSKPEGYKEKQAFISYNKCDYNVFCASTIITDTQNNVVAFDKKNKKNFGNYGVIIINTQVFIERLKDSIRYNKNVYQFWANFVKYLDYKKRNSIQYWSPFMKFDFFKEQQEWRIVFDAETNEVLNYNLGDIHDICYLINDKDKFFDSIVEGAQLNKGILL